MATWRYSETNSAEMADVGATAASAAASHCVTSEQDSLDDDNSVDLSYSDLDQFPLSVLDSCPQQVRCLHVTNNHIEVLPSELGLFTNLVSLDISNNRLKSVADEICSLRRLRTFVARNNFLCVESIPKDFGTLPSLAVLNLSGNQLTHLPVQFTELPQLRCLYLGANQISVIPPEVQNMSKYVDFIMLCYQCVSDLSMDVMLYLKVNQQPLTLAYACPSSVLWRCRLQLAIRPTDLGHVSPWHYRRLCTPRPA